MFEKLFFYNVENLLQILISAPFLYFSVIALVRISGKRSTSQMNNFDWIVTVAMGSLVASAMVLKNVTLIEVLLAISALLLLQFLVTRSLLDSKVLRRLVKASPTLLVRKGEYLRDAMRDERVTEGEVLSAVRGSGVGRLEDVEAVILETDASLSVIASRDGTAIEAMTSLGDMRQPSGSGNDDSGESADSS
ncbi:MAG: DUF421 domain-containing protein [Gammaproteobacteria bacterium]|nr:DUF421 domain-containing protein [Gammaproteobacteria bacterium]NND61397.1 DUF421 domain-containing protein [Gammaproteobacteria bacterium]